MLYMSVKIRSYIFSIIIKSRSVDSFQPDTIYAIISNKYQNYQNSAYFITFFEKLDAKMHNNNDTFLFLCVVKYYIFALRLKSNQSSKSGKAPIHPNSYR